MCYHPAMDYTIFTPSPSAGGTVRRLIRSSGMRPRYVVDCRDELSVGPLLPLDDLQHFATTRSRFWRNLKMPVTAKGYLTSLHNLQTTLKARPVEIWVGNTVQEQFTLLAFLALVHTLNLPHGHVRLLQFPFDQARIGLGGYREEDMAGHPPAEVPSPTTLATYYQAWEALTAPTPHALFDLSQLGTGLPPLDRALRAFVQRYPEQKSGLGSIERRVLQAFKANDKVKSSYIIAEAMALHGPPTDQIGDGILFAHLIELGRNIHSKPLVDVTGDGQEMRSTQVSITDFGKACLAGEANRIEANGLDDHIAGVHLSSKTGRLWLRAGVTLA